MDAESSTALARNDTGLAQCLLKPVFLSLGQLAYGLARAFLQSVAIRSLEQPPSLLEQPPKQC